jgi:hypothetical protein
MANLSEDFEKLCSSSLDELINFSCSDGDFLENESLTRLFLSESKTSKHLAEVKCDSSNSYSKECLTIDSVMCASNKSLTPLRSTEAKFVRARTNFEDDGKSNRWREENYELAETFEEVCGGYESFLKKKGPCANKTGDDFYSCVNTKIYKDPQLHSKLNIEFAITQNPEFSEIVALGNGENALGYENIKVAERNQEETSRSDISDLKMLDGGGAPIIKEKVKLASKPVIDYTQRLESIADQDLQNKVQRRFNERLAEEQANGDVTPEQKQKIYEEVVNSEIKDRENKIAENPENSEMKEMYEKQIADMKKMLAEMRGQSQMMMDQMADLNKDDPSSSEVSRSPASVGAQNGGGANANPIISGAGAGGSFFSGQNSTPNAIESGSGFNSSSILPVTSGLAAARDLQDNQETSSLKLTVGSEKIPVANVLSVEVQNITDQKTLEDAILAKKGDLVYGSDGYALVEVIDQASLKKKFVRVKLDKNKLVFKEFNLNEAQALQSEITEVSRKYRLSNLNRQIQGQRSND